MLGQSALQLLSLGLAERWRGCILQHAVEKPIRQLEAFLDREFLEGLQESGSGH